MVPNATQKDGDAHDTAELLAATLARPGSKAGALHEPPLNVAARLALSTATQNDADGHDTDTNISVSIRAGALHEMPLNVAARPAWSTATQNEADGHDTDIR